MSRIGRYRRVGSPVVHCPIQGSSGEATPTIAEAMHTGFEDPACEYSYVGEAL